MLLRFSSESKRDAFFHRLEEERQDIAQRSRPAKTRPDLIVGDLTPEQVRWLQAELGPGAVFADVKFEPLTVD